MPIIWQSPSGFLGDIASPGYSSRSSMYGVGGIPHAQFGGTIADVGGGTTYPRYLGHYNTISALDSPLEITASLDAGSSGGLAIIADIEVTGDITTTNNKVVYMLTRRINDEYYCSVVSYDTEPFTLSAVGETISVEFPVTLNESWSVSELSAVVLVQSFSGDNEILQAGSGQFSGMLPLFSTDITTGPAQLAVQFTSHSFPLEGIDSYEWDFDGDGTYDSTLENPYHIYDTPGVYDVKLKITAGTETAETVATGLINVTDGSAISGELNGIWSADYGIYTITEDVNISAEHQLIIEPGTQIKIENEAQISVVGLLSLTGTDSERIILSSDSSWRGLKFSYSEQINKVEYCDISGSSYSAIFVDNSIVEISNNKIHHNTSTSIGAAMDINNTENVVVKNNLIANNTSTGNSGAIGCLNAPIDIHNNIIVNNTGTLAGAFVLKNLSNVSLVNNTIANNQAANAFFVFGSNPEIRNSIIVDSNNMFQNINGLVSVDYSNITGGFGGVGNLDTDPMFSSASAGNGAEFNGLNADWTLAVGSPCIDAGDPASEYNDGDGSRNDMGAFGGINGFIVDSEEDQVQPVNENTLGVYPNPFNPSTTISLNLKDDDLNKPVSMAIFNVKGQLVKTVLDNQIAEKASYNWNGKDNAGSATSSGIYFVQLKTANETTTSKMVLMK